MLKAHLHGTWLFSDDALSMFLLTGPLFPIVDNLGFCSGMLFIKPFPSKLSSNAVNFKVYSDNTAKEGATSVKNNCATLLQLIQDRFIFATLLYKG